MPETNSEVHVKIDFQKIPTVASLFKKKIFFLSELCLSILNPGIIGQCEEFIVSISEQQIDKT